MTEKTTDHKTHRAPEDRPVLDSAAKPLRLLETGHLATITTLYPEKSYPDAEIIDDVEPIVAEVLNSAMGSESLLVNLWSGSETMDKIEAGLKSKGHTLPNRTRGYKILGQGDNPSVFENRDLANYIPKSMQSPDRNIPSEGVIFRPHIETAIETIQEPVRTGRVFKKTVIQNTTRNTERHPTHREVTGGLGLDEPAIRVTYHYSGGNIWTDELGSPNKHFAAGFDLPRSQADKLRTALEVNPKLIRDIAGGIAQNYGIPETVWNHGELFYGLQTVRPPYEEMDESQVPIVVSEY